VRTPAPVDAAAGPDPSSEEAKSLSKSETTLYQVLVGSLMFAMTMCRPDIAFTVGLLARRMATPRRYDATLAKRCLRYLICTPLLGILFHFDAQPQPGLLAYVDSDWANDPIKRKSTTGYVTVYNGAPISWLSALQAIIALSSTAAEYVALTDCCREIHYLRELLEFLRRAEPEPTPIYEDNQGAIDLSKTSAHHKRSKHIDVRYHWIRQSQRLGIVIARKVDTAANRADIFTKPVDAVTFARHVGALMSYAPHRESPAPGISVVGGCEIPPAN